MSCNGECFNAIEAVLAALWVIRVGKVTGNSAQHTATTFTHNNAIERCRVGRNAGKKLKFAHGGNEGFAIFEVVVQQTHGNASALGYFSNA